VLVLGDVMLDQFIWGGVSRISAEAPVPVVDSSVKVSCPRRGQRRAHLTRAQVPTEILARLQRRCRPPVENMLNEQKSAVATGDARRAAYQCQNPHVGTNSKWCALTAKRATIWTGV